ncbi:MAG TPA: hypothetical protein VFQ69_00290 [Rhizomicrobium sp.]|nr:hypothetical protein [Rhizomicrobium sp.]
MRHVGQLADEQAIDALARAGRFAITRTLCRAPGAIRTMGGLVNSSALGESRSRLPSCRQSIASICTVTGRSP